MVTNTVGEEARTGRLGRVADRLDRWSFRLLMTAVVVSLLGAGFYAAAYDLLPAGPPPTPYECLEPPCFFGGPPPGVRDIPLIIGLPIYLLSLSLAVPAALFGLWSLIRRSPEAAGRRFLALFGVLFVIVYQELGGHLPIICAGAPGMCENAGGSGLELSDRWHQFGHVAFAGLPALLVYWLVRRAVERNPRVPG
jgi:hypothetical protein